MSDIFCNRYGSILEEDAQVMDATLAEVPLLSVMKVCEIGMYSGATAAGINNVLSKRGAKVEYYGIDAGLIIDPQVPFSGATVIKGDSSVVCGSVPLGLSILFIDGCHCISHVMADIQNYCPKVLLGGFVLFHDTSPFTQGIDRQPCGSTIGVLRAFDKLGWPFPNWELFMEKFRPDFALGGMSSYRRTA